VANNTDNLGIPSAANLSIEALAEIQTTSEELPSPALIANAVIPEVISGER
jgi:hypothetical protein